ncbi:hypothetical protein K440DRAFT_646208 [Wilcoxina mikolae CBS 423.85]|nr:hypothetical protein K440DRAFT_646208 [Wilcoxina mikolae CBS 423.85]
MNTIITKMADCEFYACMYSDTLQVTLNAEQTTLAFKEAVEFALPKFYAAILVFSVKAKGYFASSIASKLTTPLVPFSIMFQPHLDRIDETQRAFCAGIFFDKSRTDNSEDLQRMGRLLDDLKGQLTPLEKLDDIQQGINEIKSLVNKAPDRQKTADNYLHQVASKQWYRILPYCQNNAFTRRDSLSAQLAGFLSKEGHRRVALCGLGGVGKTQIALQYVYQQIHSECHIFWVHGGSKATFNRDYHRIMSRIGLSVTDSDEDKALLKLRDWLENEESGNWILVVDNADNPSEYQANRMGMAKYIPQGTKGTLIITTRSGTVASRLGCKSINVPKMDPNDAEELLLRLCTETVDDTNLMRDLLQALDYLPLAIAAAAAYMRETGTLPTEYLEMLNSSHQASLLMSEFNDIHREPQNDGASSAEENEGMTESVLTTYYITFRRIRELCPLAADILRLIAFFDRQAIPERFLVESGLEGADDLLSFRKAMGYLLDFL